jgi:hypothetical protein
VEKIVNEGRNGGTLNVGNPGNKGGTGRPPDEIRRKFREILSGAGTERIEAIVTRSEEGDVLRAVDLCAKYGLGEAQVFLENTEVFEAIGKMLPSYLAQDQCKQFLEELKGRLSK